MMELILTDEEYYDLFKSLRFAIDQRPDVLSNRKDLLARLTKFYKDSGDKGCEFVITMKVKEEANGAIL